MNDHRRHVSEELGTCSLRAQALFAFFCAERLRGCCWAYQAAGGVDLSPFFRWSETLFELLVSPKPIDPATIAVPIEELDSIVPRNAAEPLLVQAQRGLI